MTDVERRQGKRATFEMLQAPWSRRTVVVVEPYASGRETICACIVELGHGVIGAGSLEHAARLVADGSDERVDLLVVAHDMPWIDGWGFLAHLHSRPYVPAIVVCDDTDDRPIRRTLAIRPCFSLRRTFSLAELETTIGVVTRSRRPP